MFDRITSDITSDLAVLGGKPIARGTRISVQMILQWGAAGATRAEIVGKHPELIESDIEQTINDCNEVLNDFTLE